MLSQPDFHLSWKCKVEPDPEEASSPAGKIIQWEAVTTQWSLIRAPPQKKEAEPEFFFLSRAIQGYSFT